MELLESLRSGGYVLGPVRRYFEGARPPFVFLRHDVDRFPFRAVRMAAAEQSLGVAATYYFRCTGNEVFPADSIRAIADLNHEIGFHYESVVRCRGDVVAAFESFGRELAALRELAEVKTVAAHGSPLSRFPTTFRTGEVNVKELGLLGDPQVDFDYSQVLYITDTGGIFGSPHNRRDWSDGKNLRTPTSPCELGRLLSPEEEPLVLMNTHPERWPGGFMGLLQAGTMDLVVNGVKLLVS